MREAILGATIRAAIVMMVGCEDEKRRWRVWSRYEEREVELRRVDQSFSPMRCSREGKKGRRSTKEEFSSFNTRLIIK